MGALREGMFSPAISQGRRKSTPARKNRSMPPVLMTGGDEEFEFLQPNEQELNAAVRDCTEHGLICAARWAAEQLCGLPEPEEDEEDTQEEIVYQHTEESDKILLAQAYLQNKEFARAAHLLDDYQ